MQYVLSLPKPSYINDDGTWIIIQYSDEWNSWLMMSRKMMTQLRIIPDRKTPRNEKWVFCEQNGDALVVLKRLKSRSIPYIIEPFALPDVNHLIRILE